MPRGWHWALSTLFVACNADQFSNGGDASSDVTTDNGVITNDVAEAGCGDTQSTAANCGACGHSCGGGQCVAGVCQPAVFSTLGRPIESLALDDTTVYLGSDVIYSCARGGCGGSPAAISGSAAPAIATRNILAIAPFARNASAWLLYANYGDGDGGTYGYVGACAAADCLSDAGHLFDLPKAATAAVYAAGQVGFSGAPGIVKEFALDGGAPSPSNFFSGGQVVLSTVVDSGNLVIGTAGGVYTCALGNCVAPTLLSTPATVAMDVAVHNNVVYWTEALSQSVQSCPISGCGNAPKTLFSAGGAVGDVVVSSSGKLYMAVNYAGASPTPDTGSIMTCDVTTTCTPSTLAGGRNFPWHLAQNGQVLFWTEGLELVSPLTGSPPYEVIRLTL